MKIGGVRTSQDAICYQRCKADTILGGIICNSISAQDTISINGILVKGNRNGCTWCK